MENIQQQDVMVPQPFRIQRVHKETQDVFTLDLSPKDGVAPLDYAPGQFNMLYVFGVGEVPVSISGHSETSEGWLHTIREVGTVTRALHGLKRDGMVGLRGPFGTSWPMEQAEGSDVVLIAGGIGLAPLRPALRYIQSRRDRFGEVALLYGARTPGDLLFRKERDHWRARFGMQVKVTVDSADRDWKSNVGVVTHLVPRVSFDPANTMAFVCGPEVMMRFSVAELKQRGVPENRIYISMERNMKCAVGFCGHCQFGPSFICKDGPVFRYDHISRFLNVREF